MFIHPAPPGSHGCEPVEEWCKLNPKDNNLDVTASKAVVRGSCVPSLSEKIHSDNKLTHSLKS